MRYAAFGRKTGLRVSEYALGTANFGTGWGAGAEPDEARRIFDRFAEAGGTFLDSADSYLAALDVQLTDEQYAPLDKVSAMPLGVPREGIAGSLGLLQGGDASSVIAPVVPVA
ncbi:aldo/keto reductase [Streptomyces sp. OZ13]|uniref:aldo/keto reductase n=1 Tax=Streptomyces sp. OZ13 TaxID=3452210 RepID=UPI003F8B60D6